jgi:hypothetical protein
MANNFSAELGSEIGAQLITKFMGKGAQALLGLLVDKGTGRVREDALHWILGNEATVDGLFKRATMLVVEKGKATSEERAIYLRVLKTIPRTRQNDYRLFMVASCFGHEDLKKEKMVTEDKFLPVLADMIADDIKMAVEHYNLPTEHARNESAWMYQVRFYDLDHGIEDGLDEYEVELHDQVEHLRANRPRLIKWILGIK